MSGGGRVARVVLVAEESAGGRALQLIHASGHELVAVLTGADAPDPGGRGSGVAGLAGGQGVPTRPASVVRDPSTAAWLRAERIDVLINVHSLHVVHPAVVSAPRIGSLNLHPGPLPEYAGLDAPSWAIYHGRRRHGVTLHWMTPGIDAGPVAFTADVELTDTDTGLTASAKCAERGLPLIGELLDRLRDGSGIPAVEQDPTRRHYYRRTPPHRGWIPWSGTAREVVDLVRACDYSPWPSPWGQARTVAPDDRVIEVVRARRTGRDAGESPGTVGAVTDDGALVAAADEWVLLNRIRIDGLRVDVAAALRPGDRLAEPTPVPIAAVERSPR